MKFWRQKFRSIKASFIVLPCLVVSAFGNAALIGAFENGQIGGGTFDEDSAYTVLLSLELFDGPFEDGLLASTLSVDITEELSGQRIVFDSGTEFENAARILEDQGENGFRLWTGTSSRAGDLALQFGDFDHTLFTQIDSIEFVIESAEFFGPSPSRGGTIYRRFVNFRIELFGINSEEDFREINSPTAFYFLAFALPFLIVRNRKASIKNSKL
ncbi:hypothetical protein [Glaciecola sp. KUL10]|uniref:hypothetical protein n=1 Tax=Glaciecola sp. (strain KUL10) TaxID=2161813 RepID=UPI000D787824|nr:hypothetical protein [Glaciecola sp. KUL10]